MAWARGWLVALELSASGLGSAWAGRPFVTEDAGVIARGNCELEASYAHLFATADSPRGRNRTLQVACGVGGRTQLTLAGRLTHEDDERLQGVAIVGKTRLHPVADDDGVPQWAVAWTLDGGKTRTRSFGRGGHAATLVYTRPFGAAASIHANLGWSRDTTADRSSTTWGLAYERKLRESFDAGVEVFGDDREPAFAAAVMRWTVIDGLMLDAALARQVSHPRGKVLTMGLKYAW